MRRLDSVLLAVLTVGGFGIASDSGPVGRQLDMQLTYELQYLIDGRTAVEETGHLPLEQALDQSMREANCLAISDTPGEEALGLDYTPTWVDPNNNPGFLRVSAGALPGNHLTDQGMVWVSPGVLYFAWVSYDWQSSQYSVIFTRLIGSARYGYYGTSMDVVYSSNYPIDEVRLVRQTNDATYVTWRMTQGAFRSVYGSLWNGTCWGSYSNGTCTPENLTWPISNVVNGYGLSLNPATNKPGIAWTDSLRRVWERDRKATAWEGQSGGWANLVFEDPNGSVYSQINKAVCLHRTNGVKNVVFTGTYLGKPTNVRVRYYNGGWRGYFGQTTNVLPVKSSALISASIDKYWGRLYVAGQWEIPNQHPQVWFVLQGPGSFQGVGGAAYDWVSAWKGYFPVVDSDNSSRPFCVFMNPQDQETSISYWQSSWWGGYMSNPNNRRPTPVSTDNAGQWAASFSKDPTNKAHVAYTTCTATSPTCAVSEIRYTRER